MKEKRFLKKHDAIVMGDMLEDSVPGTHTIIDIVDVGGKSEKELKDIVREIIKKQTKYQSFIKGDNLLDDSKYEGIAQKDKIYILEN